MLTFEMSLRMLLMPAATLILLAGCNTKAEMPDVISPSAATPTLAVSEPTVSPQPAVTAGPADAGSFSYSGGIDDNGFWTGVKALDYVENLNYKAISIPGSVYQVSDSDLQSKIDSTISAYTTRNQIKDRAVKDGDTVNIDYVGSVAGVKFNGGSTDGKGTDVTIGVTNYIDDFLQQLIGHKPGDSFDVNVTFPTDYQEKTLAGKDAVFATTINYIVEKVAPELTDDFVLKNLNGQFGWKTVNDMKEDLRQQLEKSAVQQYIQDYLVKDVTIKSVPDQLIKYQEDNMINLYRQYAKQYGMTLDDFISKYEGVTGTDGLIIAKRDINLNKAKFILVIQAVAEDAGISVSDADVADFMKKNTGSADYASYEQQFGKPYLKQAALVQKVMDYVTGNVVKS